MTLEYRTVKSQMQIVVCAPDEITNNFYMHVFFITDVFFNIFNYKNDE